MKKLFLGVLVIMLTVILSGCGFNLNKNQNASANQKKEPIKIGAIIPITGDGSTYGELFRRSADLATNEINDAGGVNGKKINIVYEDGKCGSGNEAATAAQKLINIDKVKVIFAFCSGEIMKAAPITESAKVILFSSGAGSPNITNAGDYVFRNFPSDASSGKEIAKLAILKNFKKAAVLYENTDYGLAIKDVFKNNFEGLGGKIVAEESYESNAIDIRKQLTKIKSAKPDALYLVPNSEVKSILELKQTKELNIEAMLFSNETVSADSVKKLAEGVIFSTPAFDQDSPKVKELLNNYAKRYGKVDTALPPFYITATYDAIYLIKDMITSYGYDATSIKDGLYKIKNRETVTGNLTLDQNGDPAYHYILMQIKNGESVLLN